MKQNEDEVRVTEDRKEPYQAPLLTQHEPLRALTGSSGGAKVSDNL
jgi:hypothetical protein